MFSLIADALDYLWALSVSKGIIQIINAILDLYILKLAEQSDMISPAVSIKSLGCLIWKCATQWSSSQAFLSVFCAHQILGKFFLLIEPRNQTQPYVCQWSETETEALIKINFFVCLWKHKVRRFSEAYFFTEHHKEISLTFQEEL